MRSLRLPRSRKALVGACIVAFFAVLTVIGPWLAPYNPSATETVVAVIARTDPNEQESVVLLPELESIHPA